MLAIDTTPDTELTSLSDAQRDGLMADLDRDGYAVLPGRLPEALRLGAIAAIDGFAARDRADDPSIKSIKRSNCVALDPAFVELMMHEPALQLSYDALGPVFQLNQSNFQSRMREEGAKADFIAATGWHADGPRPSLFPRVANAHGHGMGLHYLKFGYFFTDLTHGNGGSLQVVRGSHRRPELDGKAGDAFDIEDYDDDLVQFDCPAGSVVAFHQAQWHAAPANLSEHERKNAYISYCPPWMKPLDYDTPRPGEDPNGLAGLSDEASFLLGEYRPPLQFWLPTPEQQTRLSRFGRGGG